MKAARTMEKSNGQYIPHPSTWLNAKGWEDEIDEEKEPYYGPTLIDCGKCKRTHEEGATCEAV